MVSFDACSSSEDSAKLSLQLAAMFVDKLHSTIGKDHVRIISANSGFIWVSGSEEDFL